MSVSVDVTERKRAIVQLRAFAEAHKESVKARTRELEAENEARKKAEESLSSVAEDGGRRSSHRRRGTRFQ